MAQFLPMVGKLAMKLAVRAAPQLYRYALTWAPYYAVKFSAYYTVKRYGVPRIYRALLRANKRTPHRKHGPTLAPHLGDPTKRSQNRPQGAIGPCFGVQRLGEGP